MERSGWLSTVIPELGTHGIDEQQPAAWHHLDLQQQGLLSALQHGDCQ